MYFYSQLILLSVLLSLLEACDTKTNSLVCAKHTNKLFLTYDDEKLKITEV